MLRWLILAVVVYVLLVGLMVWFETALVYPAPRGGTADATDHGAEDVFFPSADGTNLHGWYYERPQPRATLIFFHGNGESIEWSGAWFVELAKKLQCSGLIFDYRGYGRSEGRPSEAGVVADGIAAVQWLANRTGKAPSEFVYLGRSLGGGVAIQVAKQHPPAGLVLVSTFSSMVDVAQSAYPIMPVRWLMNNRYESGDVLESLSVPLLQIHGERDRIIPIKFGKRLFKRSPAENKKWIAAEDYGHNNLPLEAFLREIRAFLDQLTEVSEPGGDE